MACKITAAADVKPDKPRRFDMVPPAAIGRVKPHKAMRGQSGQVLADRALDVTFHQAASFEGWARFPFLVAAVNTTTANPPRGKRPG